MPQCMAARFGNVCLCQNTQREGKKQHAKEKEKTKTQINFSGRSTLNSELDSENQCSSNTQIHKTNDHHRNCKQVRDYPQSAEILPVEQTGMTTQGQERRVTQRSETERKIVSAVPSFTPDYCFTVEDSTQTSELPAQDFKHTTIFPLRETTTAPNKAL